MIGLLKLLAMFNLAFLLLSAWVGIQIIQNGQPERPPADNPMQVMIILAAMTCGQAVLYTWVLFNAR